MTDSPTPLPIWEYATPGPLRERLSGLTLAGAKTTTFGIDEITLALGDPLEEVGDRFVMVGTNGAQLAVVEVVDVERVRLADVRWEQVEREGESFTDVAHWREAHERFWAPFVDVVRASLGDAGWRIDDDTVVTCVTLRVVERLAGHNQARYPVVECIVAADDAELCVDELSSFAIVGVEEIDGGDGVAATNGRAVAAGQVLLRAGFASDEDAVVAERELDRRFAPRFEVLLGDDWLDAWREHFEAVRVRRFVIVPDWPGASTSRPDARPDDIELRLDPGRSFGTGGHPSTRLVLDALQDLALRGATVADVGCGSGVLAIAALLLGAAHAVASDVELAALDATLDNARRNDVSDRVVAVKADESAPMGPFDVVLANILAPVLIELAPRLIAMVASGGCLVLAGLIEEQQARVLDAMTSAGPLRLERELGDGSWRALVLRRS